MPFTLVLALGRNSRREARPAGSLARTRACPAEKLRIGVEGAARAPALRSVGVAARLGCGFSGGNLCPWEENLTCFRLQPCQLFSGKAYKRGGSN